MVRKSIVLMAVLLLTFSSTAWAEAEPPWQRVNDTRVLAIGDSITAGTGAQPVTNGYAYLLYRKGVFDTVPNTWFANAAVPSATSGDVLLHQVPQTTFFPPDVVVMTVGGNDLLNVLPAFFAIPPLDPDFL